MRNLSKESELLKFIHTVSGYVVNIFNKNRVNLTNVAFTFRFRFILSFYSLVGWKKLLTGWDSVLLLTAATEML